MDRSLDSRSWQRGFAVGFLALALSVGGHLATARAVESGASCPLDRQPAWSHRLFERISERIESHAMARRVALALLERVLHGSCS